MLNFYWFLSYNYFSESNFIVAASINPPIIVASAQILRTISNAVVIRHSLLNNHILKNKKIPRKKKLPYLLLGQISPVKITPKNAKTEVNAHQGIALDQPKFPKKYWL